MKKIPIKEMVYEQLKEMIITGEIAPGSRIIENECCEKFNVSRTPVREALRMLELENYVKYNAYGGVIVPEITISDIEEVYKIRIALEGIILEEAINKGTKLQFLEIEELLNFTDALIESNAPAKEVFKTFSKFNELLYEIANLPRVIEMITNITLYLRRFRKLAVENEGQRANAHKNHRDILVALKEKNLKKALKLNKVHLENSKMFIIKKF